MQSQEIAATTGESRAETAKVLQLLVWGGFVTSRRGSKGGFQLAASPNQITTGKVIKFFLAKHPVDEDGDCPVICALRETVTPCQEAFARLTLADIVTGHTRNLPPARRSKSRCEMKKKLERLSTHRHQFPLIGSNK